MDGLECSEIRMSDVCDTTTLRFDSDYYKKEYLEIEQFICKNRDKFVTIEYSAVSTGFNRRRILFEILACYMESGWCRRQVAN